MAALLVPAGGPKNPLFQRLSLEKRLSEAIHDIERVSGERLLERPGIRTVTRLEFQEKLLAEARPWIDHSPHHSGGPQMERFARRVTYEMSFHTLGLYSVGNHEILILHEVIERHPEFRANPEGFFTQILIHEAAHAFANKGTDQARAYWVGTGFSQSDLPEYLIEGHADYLTYRVLELRRGTPAADQALGAMNSITGGPYRTGREFFMALADAGLKPSLREVVENHPASLEEIENPELYIARRRGTVMP